MCKLVDSLIKAKYSILADLAPNRSCSGHSVLHVFHIFLLPCRTHTIISGRQFPLASGKFTWQWPIKNAAPEMSSANCRTGERSRMESGEN